MHLDDRSYSNLLHWLAGLDAESFRRVCNAVTASAILRDGAAPAEPWATYDESARPTVRPVPLGSRLDVTG